MMVQTLMLLLIRFVRLLNNKLLSAWPLVIKFLPRSVCETKMVAGVLHRRAYLVVAPTNCGLRLLAVGRVSATAPMGRHTLSTTVLLLSRWTVMGTPLSRTRLPLTLRTPKWTQNARRVNLHHLWSDLASVLSGCRLRSALT